MQIVLSSKYLYAYLVMSIAFNFIFINAIGTLSECRKNYAIFRDIKNSNTPMYDQAKISHYIPTKFSLNEFIGSNRKR